MYTLIAYGIVACAFGWMAQFLLRSMRFSKRYSKRELLKPELLKPGCGACCSECRGKKDKDHGKC